MVSEPGRKRPISRDAAKREDRSYEVKSQTGYCARCWRRLWRDDHPGAARSIRAACRCCTNIIDAVTDLEGFKALPAKSVSCRRWVSAASTLGIRTEKITALDGSAPKRFVVIAFDSSEKAKAWKASASAKEVDAIRGKTTKSTQFLVEGM